MCSGHAGQAGGACLCSVLPLRASPACWWRSKASSLWLRMMRGLQCEGLHGRSLAQAERLECRLSRPQLVTAGSRPAGAAQHTCGLRASPLNPPDSAACALRDSCAQASASCTWWMNGTQRTPSASWTVGRWATSGAPSRSSGQRCVRALGSPHVIRLCSGCLHARAWLGGVLHARPACGWIRAWPSSCELQGKAR